MLTIVYMSYDLTLNMCRIAYKCSTLQLLFPSIVTQKLLTIPASYYRIKNLRAHITQKYKILNIHKCWVLQIMSNEFNCSPHDKV